MGGNGINELSGKSDRDIAMEAIHRIDTHEQVCNQKGETMTVQINGLVDGQKQIIKSLDEQKVHLKALYNRWWAAAIGGLTAVSGLCIYLVQLVVAK